MRAKERFAVGVLAAVALDGGLAAGQSLDRRQLERIEQTLRHEGEAVAALADEAARNDSAPSDFSLGWHNDFLKAQTGTFVPFIVSIAPARLNPPAALLYVRAAPRHSNDPENRRRSRGRSTGAAGLASYPFEEVYPVDLSVANEQPVRVARGFSLAPGEYDVTVVVREREGDENRGRRRMAAVLRRALHVPDFTANELMTSTVIVADRLTVLPDPSSGGNLAERPYVIAGRDIRPVVDRVFRRSEELIVVFLVYNPFVTTDKHFDLEVEYHFFRQSGTGEEYFNRTESQRFNPVTLGPHYDPSGGQPVMAGQGVPLAGFQIGDYRLTIKVTDLVSGRSISREVTFAVRA